MQSLIRGIARLMFGMSIYIMTSNSLGVNDPRVSAVFAFVMGASAAIGWND